MQRAFDIWLDQLIIENKINQMDGWSLHAQNLSHDDKKQFLSYLTDVDDYIYFTENPIRERVALGEYEPEMQFLINERIDDLYHEIQRELSEPQYE